MLTGTAMNAEALSPTDPRSEDKALVRRMIAGDERAFEEFADGHIPALYRFALIRLDRDRELTCEIVQSTVCKAIAKLASFRGEAALMTWLCACCRREIAAHFRRKLRSVREVELMPDSFAAGEAVNEAPSDGPEEALLRKEAAHLVHIALDLLPPRYGKALEWKYLEKVSVKEIAKRLSLGPKAAESLLTRARQSFKDSYASLVARAQATAQIIEPANRRVVSKS